MKRNNLGSDAIQAMKSVVRIHAEGLTESNCQSILDPRFAIPMQWTGSGFFIKLNGEKGYILTNAHVARNASVLQCMSLLTSEEYFQLEIVGLVESLDPDIALLRMPADECARFCKLAGHDVPGLEIAGADALSRGMDLKAIGYPLGMAEPNISGGELSNFISGDFNYSERIVTDAAINPGNSGGPAVIQGGLVAGINTATIIDASNIGFITPGIYCSILLDNLRRQETALLAHLGAIFQKNSKNNSAWLKQAEPDGVILTKVFKRGTCHRAGLRKWDVVIGIDDLRFDRHGILRSRSWTHHENIYDLMRRIPLGKPITLHYLRDGQALSVVSEVQAMPQLRLRSQPIVSERRFLEFQGLILQDVTIEILASLAEMYDINTYLSGAASVSDRSCVVITHIEQGSEAERLELEIGDLILKVNGRAVYSLQGFVAQLAQASTLVLETRQGGLGVFALDPNAQEKWTIRKVGEKL